MINRLNIETTSINVIGDIHGNYDTLAYMLEKHAITNTIIIVAGDCGLGFTSVEGTKNDLNYLDDVCKANNDFIIMLRGNHDNPMFFNTGCCNTEHIIAVPDYTVLNDEILLVGGAISIDRTYRLNSHETRVKMFMEEYPNMTRNEIESMMNQGYWKDEAPIYNEESMQELKDLKIKHVVTHTCPSFCEPLTKYGIEYWLKNDDCLEDDVDNERDVMDKIYNELKNQNHPIKTWTYGHYHRHNEQVNDDIVFTMLSDVKEYDRNIDYKTLK